MSLSRTIAMSAALVFVGLILFSTPTARAQEQGAQRTVLQKQDLSVPGYEGVLVRTELAPGASEPKHTHPGDFFGYVLEGTVTIFQEGQPALHLSAGANFFVPAGRVHGAANEGTTTVKLLVSFFVQKGKPLTTPVQ